MYESYIEFKTKQVYPATKCAHIFAAHKLNAQFGLNNSVDYRKFQSIMSCVAAITPTLSSQV